MKKFFIAFTLLVAGASSAFAQWGRPVDYAAGPGLKDAYKDYFTIGVAVNRTNVSDPAQIEIIKKQFNSVTAENAWKPGEIHPEEGVWNFGLADSIANFCRENGIKMRGHCLCWHSQFADWMFTDKKGKPVKKEVFYKRLREHIHTVVNRYKDVVYAWDVVNEAIADDNMMFRGFRPGGPAPSPYRQSRHFELCGDEFIAKAFEFAREADPTGVLIYNDYSTVDEGKRERIYNMVKKMKDAGVPIDGIGMQGHYNVYFPDEEQLEKTISRFSEIVNTIHITELDLRTNMESGGQLMFSRGEAKPQPAYIQTLQEDQYNRLFRIFRKHKDVIKNVTFWNLSDKDSWLGVNNHPLPFDENFKVEAPDAKSVIVSLGLGGRGGTVLRKDKDGVWVGTTEGPMDPGFHYYHLTIDGGVFNDPGTHNYFGSCRWESGIEIPAPDQDFYAERTDIPHGNMQKVLFYSKSLGKMQEATVYLPNGYGKVVKGKQERYPVLYLQHGWGENETSWPVQGKAGLIMDNLINDGKIKPFIIVMAYGLTNNIKFGTIGQFTAKEFEAVLVDELIPFIDPSARTSSRIEAVIVMAFLSGSSIFCLVVTPPIFSSHANGISMLRRTFSVHTTSESTRKEISLRGSEFSTPILIAFLFPGTGV